MVDPSPDPVRGRMSRSAIGLLTAGSAIAIVLAASSGIRHDYGPYLLQWRLVLAGKNPWSTDNAYGPIHNLLAYLLRFGDQAPKIFMATLFLFVNALFVREAAKLEGSFRRTIVYLLLIPGNALILIFVLEYGSNDTLVAALVLLAVLFRMRKRFILAGAFIGLAALVKFSPLFLALFFALDKRRINYKIVLSAASVFGLGMCLAFLEWGKSIFTPIRSGAARGANLMSFMNALSSHSWLVGGDRNLGFLIKINFLLVILVAVASLALSYKLNLNWFEGSILSFLLILVTYKVGNSQFFITWICLLASSLLVRERWSDILQMTFMPLVVLLALFQFSYTFIYDTDRSGFGLVIRHNVGFLMLPLSLFLCASYLRKRDSTTKTS